MTAVLVYSTTYGPQLAATIPDDPTAEPVVFSDRPTAAATVALGAKGSKATWAEYARQLVTGSPYFGWWDIVELPDGIGLRDGLTYLGQHTELTGDPPPMNDDVKLPGEQPIQ